MGYFESVGGQNTMDEIARSLSRIAAALEKHNELLQQSICSDGLGGKRAAEANETTAAVIAKLESMVG